ncbi:MAG: DUF2723 domain-containing protein [Candidatus Eisenbacteria bacterium]|nr:DUF2723 domain-containing protein [Candidatus Eisenbacteria bacterium]
MESARPNSQPVDPRHWRRVTLDLGLSVVPLLVVHLLTAGRDLGTIDSGELAATCAQLGIAHPTGYALYTLLGRISVVFLPVPAVLAVTLLSVASVAAGAWLMVQLVRRLFPLAGISDPRAVDWVPRLAGAWFGLDRVVWEQATGNEVYAPHLVLVLALLLLAVRALDREDTLRRRALLAYLAGIALAHHLTVVFLAPALLWAWFRPWFGRLGAGARRPGLATMLALPTLLLCVGYSAALYLPIRSSLNPPLDWGDPTTWSAFWRHSLAAQYRVWFFESAGQFISNLAGYFASLVHRLSPVVLLLAPWGAAVVARRAGRVAVFLGLVFFVTLTWAASYDIHDLAPYFLPADIVLIALGAIGAAALVRTTRDSIPARRVVYPLLLLSTLLQAGWNFRAVDRSGDRFVRAHTEALLASLPPDAIVLSRFWDAFVSPWVYLRQVEGLRPDVTVVDSELMRRTWYFPQLDRLDPSLFNQLSDRRRAYLSDLTLFETGRPYDPASIEMRYRALLAGLVLSQQPARPGAFTLDVLHDYPMDVQATFFAPALAVPEGLCFVLRVRPEDSPELTPPDPEGLISAGYRPEDRIHAMTVEQWRFMLRSRTIFLRNLGRNEEAARWEAASTRLQSLLAAAPSR